MSTLGKLLQAARTGSPWLKGLILKIRWKYAVVINKTQPGMDDLGAMKEQRGLAAWQGSWKKDE